MKFNSLTTLWAQIVVLGKTLCQIVNSLRTLYVSFLTITLKHTSRLCYAVARILSVVDTLKAKKTAFREEILNSLEYLIKIASFPPISSEKPNKWYVRIFHLLKRKSKVFKLRVRLVIYQMWRPFAVCHIILRRFYRICIWIVRKISVLLSAVSMSKQTTEYTDKPT